MSMVNAYITEHFIVMTGDHRRVHIEDNDVYFDDASKLFQINDRVLIGYTGDYDITLKLRAYLDKRDLKAASPNEVARICRRWLARQSKDDTQQCVLIGGLDDNENTVLIEITHYNGYEPIYITAEPGRINWRLIYANESPEPFIYEELKMIDELTPEACAELARTVNKRVAKKDNFVSPTCDVVMLVK